MCACVRDEFDQYDQSDQISYSPTIAWKGHLKQNFNKIVCHILIERRSRDGYAV